MMLRIADEAGDPAFRDYLINTLADRVGMARAPEVARERTRSQSDADALEAMFF
jgi:hypothetical protein